MNWRLPINHKYLQRLEVIDLPQTEWNTRNKQKQCQTTEFYNSNMRDGGQHTAGCALSVVTTGTATPATTNSEHQQEASIAQITAPFHPATNLQSNETGGANRQTSQRRQSENRPKDVQCQKRVQPRVLGWQSTNRPTIRGKQTNREWKTDQKCANVRSCSVQKIQNSFSPMHSIHVDGVMRYICNRRQQSREQATRNRKHRSMCPNTPLKRNLPHPCQKLLVGSMVL